MWLLLVERLMAEDIRTHAHASMLPQSPSTSPQITNNRNRNDFVCSDIFHPFDGMHHFIYLSCHTWITTIHTDITMPFHFSHPHWSKSIKIDSIAAVWQQRRRQFTVKSVFILFHPFQLRTHEKMFVISFPFDDWLWFVVLASCRYTPQSSNRIFILLSFINSLLSISLSRSCIIFGAVII